MATALYPGAYKPPHRGHFEVVKRLLNGTHNGAVYNLGQESQAGQQALSGNKSDVEDINKVVIFIGPNSRNGITPKESKAVWEIYAKYLGNVEVIYQEGNPMAIAKEYAKANPSEQFYAVTGVRNEEDFKDLKRVSIFKNRPNVQGLAIGSTEGGTRATDFRKALLSGNLDQVKDYFPSELSREEMLKILHMLKQSIISEEMSLAIDGVLEAMFMNEEKVKEGSSGTAIAPQSAVRSEDRSKLEHLYNYLKGVVPSSAYVSFQQDRIMVSLEPPHPYDGKTVYEGVDTNSLTRYIGSILEYMIEQKMNIAPLPEVKIKRDPANAGDFFGKTAYYDPNKKEIVLYVEGRHPKDICRSFTHEMVHHIQNLEGRIVGIGTTNTNESDALMELEKEAYLVGNITFRNWEDSVKNALEEDRDGKKALTRQTQLAEGKYDKISNQLSKIAFEMFKDAYDRGDKRGEFEFRVGNPEYDDVDIESTQFELDFMGVVEFTKDTYKVDGGANAGYDDDGEEIQPMINVKFMIPKNPDWQEVSMDLKDVIRHELEHLTQDGENVRQGKYIPDDQDLRNMIDNGLLDKDSYFTLPKEVDAMIQGLYYKAKKSKKPFADVVNDYLNKAMISLDNKEKVLKLWRSRLPALGIKQRL